MRTAIGNPDGEEPEEPGAAKQQENNKRVVGKPFPKGTSGNPTGRPKGAVSIIGHIRKLLAGEDEARAKQLAEALILQSAKGNGVAIRQLLDRIDGPVTQKVVVEVADSPAIDCLLGILARKLMGLDGGETLYEEIVSAWQEELLESSLQNSSERPEQSEPEN